jgi:hypothetical protein
VNGSIMNRLALETGGSHFPEVFKTYQNEYTRQVLQECYQVFLDSQQTPDKYLAIDLLYDIQKHFDINLITK